MDDVCEDFNANYTLLPLAPNLTPATPNCNSCRISLDSYESCLYCIMTIYLLDNNEDCQVGC